MSMRARRFLVVALLCFGVGCTVLSPPAAPPPPPPPVPAEEPPTEHIPVRDVLVRGEPARAGFGAYGYLIFTARPSPNTQERYTRVCESYFRKLEAAGEYPRVQPWDLMVTYWLLTRPVADSSPPKCDLLIENYDYAKANDITSAVGMHSAEGPILVAWRAPYPEGTLRDSLVLDMSRFADDDLDRALGIWKDQIARDPAMWQSGFQLVKVREALRSFVQTYGSWIIKIAAPKVIEETTPQKM